MFTKIQQYIVNIYFVLRSNITIIYKNNSNNLFAYKIESRMSWFKTIGKNCVVMCERI